MIISAAGHLKHEQFVELVAKTFRVHEAGEKWLP